MVQLALKNILHDVTGVVGGQNSSFLGDDFDRWPLISEDKTKMLLWVRDKRGTKSAGRGPGVKIRPMGIIANLLVRCLQSLTMTLRNCQCSEN